MNKNVIYFILLFLFFTRIFGLVGFNIKSSILTFVLGAFVLLEIKAKTEYSALIKLFIVCIFCSCISSYVYRGQHSIYTTFTQSFVYLGLAFYFVCSRLKIKINELEKSLVIIGLISVVAYLVQYAVYPTVIFADALNEYTTEIRIRMCGSLIYSFLFFYGINKYVTKHSAKYLLYAGLAFICIMIMGFRSLTLSLLILGFFEYLYVSGTSIKRIKQLLPIVILIFVLSQLDIVNDKIAEMLARQDRGDSFDNTDYVRYAEFDYYWNRYFTNGIERFFGSGLATMGTEFYNFTMRNYEYNMYWNDWGIVGLSWIFGIPAAVLLYYCYLKAILAKIPKEYVYLKAIFAFLILTSVTSAEAFRPGNLLLQGTFLYLIMSIKATSKQS